MRSRYSGRKRTGEGRSHHGNLDGELLLEGIEEAVGDVHEQQPAEQFALCEGLDQAGGLTD
jgi:hypothetical protein